MNHLLLYDGKEYPQGVAYAECHNAFASDLRILKEFNEIQPTKRPECVYVACSDRERFAAIIDAHATKFPTVYISNLPDYRNMSPKAIYAVLLAEGKDIMGADIEDVKEMKSAEVSNQPEAQVPAKEIKTSAAPESPKAEEIKETPDSNIAAIPVVKRQTKAPFTSEMKITRKKK